MKDSEKNIMRVNDIEILTVTGFFDSCVTMGELLKSKMEKIILDVIENRPMFVTRRSKVQNNWRAVTIDGAVLELDTLAHSVTIRVCAAQGSSELRLPCPLTFTRSVSTLFTAI